LAYNQEDLSMHVASRLSTFSPKRLDHWTLRRRKARQLPRG